MAAAMQVLMIKNKAVDIIWFTVFNSIKVEDKLEPHQELIRIIGWATGYS